MTSRLLSFVTLFGALVACDPTTPPPPARDAGTSDDGGLPSGCDAPALFARSCVAGCHDPTQRQGNLDLQTAPVGARHLNVRSSGRADYLVIDPELPDESTLVLKLNLPPPFGSQMPLGRALSTEERACVLEWVLDVVDAGRTDAGFVAFDAGVDAGATDAGTSDAGAPRDAGTFDAGAFWGPTADDAGCGPASDAGRWCVFQVVPEPLYAVRGTSSSDIWAVGSRGAAYHYDGTLWSRSDAGVGVTLFDVFPVSSTDVWAVGERGLVLRFDGQGWSPASWMQSSVDAGLLPSGQPTWDLGGVWVQGSDLVVAGGGGTLARRVGSSMQVVQSSHPNRPEPDLIRLFARSPTEWWAVGDMSIREWNGSAADWTTGRGAILRMFGLAFSNHASGPILVAVGADGMMLRYSFTDTGTYPWQPPSWSADALELRRDLRAVWLGATSGTGWAVGLDGQIVSTNIPATRHRRIVTPTGDHLLGVWGTGPDDVWAVGGRSSGVLLRKQR